MYPKQLLNRAVHRLLSPFPMDTGYDHDIYDDDLRDVLNFRFRDPSAE